MNRYLLIRFFFSLREETRNETKERRIAACTPTCDGNFFCRFCAVWWESRGLKRKDRAGAWLCSFLLLFFLFIYTDTEAESEQGGPIKSHWGIFFFFFFHDWDVFVSPPQGDVKCPSSLREVMDWRVRGFRHDSVKTPVRCWLVHQSGSGSLLATRKPNSLMVPCLLIR